jgi:membrane protein
MVVHLKIWSLLKQAVLGFINDEALSRGAAMAFFAVTSLAPILLIVVAIAGLVFGREAAQSALDDQLRSVMGDQSAQLLQSVTASAANQTSGSWAAVIGIVALLVTASGVFGEMQSALNVIWKAKPREMSVSRLIWARALSLGLVASLGFLLIVSLVISAAISAFGQFLNAHLPFTEILLTVLNELIALILIAVLFAAIYKVLPDRRLSWRDVAIGALVTALLFTAGKSMIGWYLGSSAVASSYGAASALILTLLWVYYSSLIFLFGAEITRAYSISHGSHQHDGRKLSANGQS